MQTLKSFLDQSLLIWKDSTAAARFGLAVLLVICIGVFMGFGYWSMQPHYVTLASGLAPEKLGKVADALDSADIAYTFKGASTILVDKRELPRANIAASKFGIQSTDNNMGTSNIWDDEDSKAVMNRTNREKGIALAIQKYAAVESADVKLSIPKPEAFIRPTAAPKAAVILELAMNAKFGDSHAAGIAKFVASSVSGLTVDQVVITDRQGNVYTIDESMGGLSKQVAHRLAREQELTQKAEWILLPALGFGNSAVSVATEFTFPDGTTKSTEFDPEKRVITEESIDTINTTNTAPTDGGVVGAGVNVGNAPTNTNGNQGSLSETEKIKNSFLVSKTERFESAKTPIMNSMAISVVVNKTPEEGALLKDKLQAMVQNAIGFREGKDEISIEFFEFVEPIAIESPAPFAMPWDKINNILKNVSLGIAAIIALLVARSAFKKVQSDPSTTPDVANRETQVNQLSELVQQNPEVFSKIIASWSNLDADKKSTDSLVSKAA